MRQVLARKIVILHLRNVLRCLHARKNVGVNDKDRGLDQEKKDRSPASGKQSFDEESLNIFDSDSDQIKKRKDRNRNGTVWGRIVGLNLLLPFQLGGRHKNV